MQNLDLFEAWSLWFSGQKLDNSTLFGWPILYWGRVGKAVAFIAGVAVVLDIVGAEKLRELGRRRRENDSWKVIRVFLFTAGCFSIPPFVLLILDLLDLIRLRESSSSVVNAFGTASFIGLGSWLFAVFGILFRRAVIWMLDRERPAQVLRWTSLAMLAIGFHFDFLAS